MKLRHRRGFTLVELMVTVAIVAVLAVLAFVISRKAIAKAQQAKAVSALRQVASANLAYSAENFDSINTLRWPGDPRDKAGSWVANSFWGRVQPYIFTAATSTSPKAQQRELNDALDMFFGSTDADKMTKTFLQGARIYHDTSGLPVPFGFNGQLHQWNKDVKASQFRDPTNVIYATYGFSFFKADQVREYVERPTDGTSKPVYYLDDGTAAVAFLDGRVEMLRPPIDERRLGVLK